MIRSSSTAEEKDLQPMIDQWRKPPNDSESLVDLLKDIYGFYLNQNDQAKFDLIERYWKLVSYNKIKEYNALREKGRKQLDPSFDCKLTNNPFLSLFPQSSEWNGAHIPVPVVFDD